MTAFLRDRHSWQHMIWPMHDLSLVSRTAMLAVPARPRGLFLAPSLNSTASPEAEPACPQPAQAELAVFFEYLAELGYAVVSREDNPLSLPGTGCCSEFTLVRVEQPADCG